MKTPEKPKVGDVVLLAHSLNKPAVTGTVKKVGREYFQVIEDSTAKLMERAYPGDSLENCYMQFRLKDWKAKDSYRGHEYCFRDQAHMDARKLEQAQQYRIAQLRDEFEKYGAFKHLNLEQLERVKSILNEPIQ